MFCKRRNFFMLICKTKLRNVIKIATLLGRPSSIYHTKRRLAEFHKT